MTSSLIEGHTVPDIEANSDKSFVDEDVPFMLNRLQEYYPISFGLTGHTTRA